MRFRPDLQISARALGGAGQRLIDTPHLGATMKTLFSVLLLAITAFAQNNRVLPKGAEIKVRTDSAIPAKPAAGASYGATISQDVTDTSGAVLIPRGSPARLVAVNNGKDTTLDLRSVTINGRSYLITVAGKSSSSGLGANKRTVKYVGGGAAIERCVGSAPGRRQGSCHRSSGRRCWWCRSAGLSRPKKGDSCRDRAELQVG